MLAEIELIKTRNKIISVRGKVLYNDRKRKIDLKRPIKDLFDDASMDIFYKMDICLSKESALHRMEELTKKEVMPVILYFFKGGNKDD
jgi:hypothetical protein